MTVWKESAFWKYETFERDVPPERLPGFEGLLGLWRRKRGDRVAPAWKDFEFGDFVGWFGRIVVADIFYEPFDYRYRLFGEAVAMKYRTDHTGKTGSDLVARGLEPEDDLRFYEHACRNMLIARVSGELRWLDRPHARATFAEFPLSDDGARTTHLLAAMI